MSERDEWGRNMDESVTVTMTRRQWWLTRNQVLNQADDWERILASVIAQKCREVVNQIDGQVLAPPEGDPDES